MYDYNYSVFFTGIRSINTKYYVTIKVIKLKNTQQGIYL